MKFFLWMLMDCVRGSSGGTLTRSAMGIAWLLVLSSVPSSAQDLIEFLNGNRLPGSVVAIHKPDREVEFTATLAGKSTTERYPYKAIHAVTWKGKRYVVTPLAAKTPEVVIDPAKRRTAGEIKALVAEVGSSEPGWLAETPLDYPKSLDLDWPMPAPQPWNNQKNMGQYIWDRINPNEGRWRGGIKLMMHLLATNAKSGDLKTRVQESIGGMYFRFFQDYPRAAYWWEQAKVGPGSENSVGLAECYWRMGNRSMADKLLASRTLRLGKIKLLGGMGDTREALRLADSYASQVKEPHECLLLAGDLCRQDGKFREAMTYYQRVVDLPRMENENYDERHRGRAQASIDSLKQVELLNLGQIPNGTYSGTSMGYEGPIGVAVAVRGGRIEKVEVTQHKEKQFYSAISDTTQQIVAKQNLKDIDTTSRATITSAAIINAAAKALASGQP